MVIVPAYAGILGLIFIFLTIRTVRLRRLKRVGIGDGGDVQLHRASRVHSNFSEYVPLALLLFSFVEFSAAPLIFVHLLCLTLLIGRVVHAYGVSQVKENFKYRVFGMVLTLSSLGTAAIFLIYSKMLLSIIGVGVPAG